MKTTADLFKQSAGRRGGVEALRLREAWQAIAQGRGGQLDWELAFGDLAETSEYYYIAPPDATPEQILRREGKRELFARILYLLNVPRSKVEEWQRAALTELAITSTEGERQ